MQLLLAIPSLFRWEEKIPLVRDSVEKTWLFYEIGRCYLELNCHTEAREYGCRSLDTAEEIGDDKWLLNASVLVAQADCNYLYSTKYKYI